MEQKNDIEKSNIDPSDELISAIKKIFLWRKWVFTGGLFGLALGIVFAWVRTDRMAPKMVNGTFEVYPSADLPTLNLSSHLLKFFLDAGNGKSYFISGLSEYNRSHNSEIEIELKDIQLEADRIVLPVLFDASVPIDRLDSAILKSFNDLVEGYNFEHPRKIELLQKALRDNQIKAASIKRQALELFFTAEPKYKQTALENAITQNVVNDQTESALNFITANFSAHNERSLSLYEDYISSTKKIRSIQAAIGSRFKMFNTEDVPLIEGFKNPKLIEQNVNLPIAMNWVEKIALVVVMTLFGIICGLVLANMHAYWTQNSEKFRTVFSIK